MKFVFMLILNVVILYMINLKKIKNKINNTPMSESLFQGEFETFQIGEINNKEKEQNNKSNTVKIKPARIAQDTLEEYLEKRTNNTKTNMTHHFEVVNDKINYTEYVIKIPSHNPNYKNNKEI